MRVALRHFSARYHTLTPTRLGDSCKGGQAFGKDLTRRQKKVVSNYESLPDQIMRGKETVDKMS